MNTKNTSMDVLNFLIPKLHKLKSVEKNLKNFPLTQHWMKNHIKLCNILNTLNVQILKVQADAEHTDENGKDQENRTTTASLSLCGGMKHKELAESHTRILDSQQPSSRYNHWIRKGSFQRLGVSKKEGIKFPLCRPWGGEKEVSFILIPSTFPSFWHSLCCSTLIPAFSPSSWLGSVRFGFLHSSSQASVALIDSFCQDSWDCDEPHCHPCATTKAWHDSEKTVLLKKRQKKA